VRVEGTFPSPEAQAEAVRLAAGVEGVLSVTEGRRPPVRDDGWGAGRDGPIRDRVDRGPSPAGVPRRRGRRPDAATDHPSREGPMKRPAAKDSPRRAGAVSDARGRGRPARHGRPANRAAGRAAAARADPRPDPTWDRVTQASWESLPASDAPGWR
jgi:hypothetical protein